MNTAVINPIEAGSHFDDGGLSAESAHRIRELFDGIEAMQQRFHAVPAESAPEVVALEGLVHNALYKEEVLETEKHLAEDLLAAESELESLERRRQLNHESGANKLIVEDQMRDLSAWRTGDSNAFRRWNTRAANAEADFRRIDEAREKATSLRDALASHRGQHSVIYRTDEQ